MNKRERQLYDELDASRKLTFDRFREKCRNVILNRTDREKLESEFLEKLIDNKYKMKKISEIVGNNQEEYFNKVIEAHLKNKGVFNVFKDILRIALLLPLFVIFWYRVVKGYKTSILLGSIPIGILLMWFNYITSRYVKKYFIREIISVLPMFVVIVWYINLVESYKNIYLISDIWLGIVFLLNLIIVILLNFTKNKSIDKK